MRKKLTVRTVEGLQPSTKDQIIWDTEVPGFGVKVTPTGRRSYFYYYRTRDGQQRRPIIGTHGSIRPEPARAMAREWAAEVVKGGDPSVDRHKSKVAPTVAQLCARYISEHARAAKKASSARNDEQMIRDYVLPKLGSLKVARAMRSDIQALHRGMKDTPYAANRVLALLSKMFSLAEVWGLRPEHTNPAQKVARYREQSRQRYLSTEEIRALWLRLADPAVISNSAAGAIKLLLLTGCRLQEVLQLRWSSVDLANSRAHLVDTKTGAKWIVLNSAAVELLQERVCNRADGEVYVFPGQKPGQALVNLQKPWRKVRSQLGLDDVRLHDLRHTFASIAANHGASLSVVGRLLNQTQQTTTALYTHLDANPLRLVSEGVGKVIAPPDVQKSVSETT